MPCPALQPSAVGSSVIRRRHWRPRWPMEAVPSSLLLAGSSHAWQACSSEVPRVASIRVEGSAGSWGARQSTSIPRPPQRPRWRSTKSASCIPSGALLVKGEAVITFGESFNGRFWREWVVAQKNKPTDVRSKKFISALPPGAAVQGHADLSDRRVCGRAAVGGLGREEAEREADQQHPGGAVEAAALRGECNLIAKVPRMGTMLYVADSRARSLPEETRLAAIGEADPYLRILRLLGSRGTNVPGRGPQVAECEVARLVERCEWGDSNPHAVKHRNLNPACLPIPPHSRGWTYSTGVRAVGERLAQCGGIG